MEKIRRRPLKKTSYVPEALPIGTDIYPKIKGLTELDTDLHYEIEELQYKIREAKDRRKQIEADMVRYFVEANMFWMFRINKTALRKYLQRSEELL